MANGAISTLAGPAFAVGFALSGFFDGILLHQILRWHHLLSATGRDLRFQVLADGWFHAVMYVIAAGGLWALFRARGALVAEGAARRLAGWGLVGFGAWHAVDAALSHWLLGIHRIRMDVADPLPWDLGWLAAFGIVPLAIGVLLLRGSRGPGAPRGALAGLALAVVASGAIAARPARADMTTIVFAQSVPAERAFAATLAFGGALISMDQEAGLYVVSRSEARLEDWVGAGAIYVGGGALPAGCVSWL